MITRIEFGYHKTEIVCGESVDTVTNYIFALTDSVVKVSRTDNPNGKTFTIILRKDDDTFTTCEFLFSNLTTPIKTEGVYSSNNF